ncbi:MAG: CBS domain-containing protein [Candidatus Lambdaproteobacteria bacterium]|nr:CBS domain-containing protein [Candidatus Lambdaproteobacteria bacterium]
MTRKFWFYERGEGDPDPRPLTLRSVMTQVTYTLAPGDLVMDAMHLMQDKEIRHVPIVTGEERTLVGLVTETDVLRHVLHGKGMTRDEEYHATLDMLLPLSEIMAKVLHTLPPEASVEQAVALFLEHRVHSVPVVDGQNRLQGIVTSTNLLELLRHMVSG